MNVFVSYIREDFPIASQIVQRLKLDGFNVFFDAENIMAGDSIIHRLVESIRQADIILILLSKNSVNSKWLTTEIAYSISKREKEQRGIIIPILLDANIRPPFFIRDLKYLDFSNDKEFDTSYEKLIKAIRLSTDFRYEKIPQNRSKLDYLKAQQLALELDRLEYHRKLAKKNRVFFTTFSLVALFGSLITVILVVGIIKIDSIAFGLIASFLTGVFTSLVAYRNYKQKEIKKLLLEKERLYQVLKGKYEKMSFGEGINYDK